MDAVNTPESRCFVGCGEIVHTQYDRLLASSCRLSVSLSLRLSVTLCNVHCGSQDWCTVYTAKSCTSVFLVGQDPILSVQTLKHFCCGTYRLATKRTWKKESKKTWAWDSWDTDNYACYWFIAHYLLFRTNRHRELCSSRLSGCVWVRSYTLPGRIGLRTSRS